MYQTVPQRAGRPGVRDVARHAGVSVATVSRVLNNSPRVDPDTRARIEASIATLHYVRHGAARSLTSRRSGCIGVIVPQLGTTVYAEALQAIEQRLQEEGYHMLIACCGYEPDKELQLVRAFIEHGIDGLVLVGNTHRPLLYEIVEQSGLPAVQTFGAYPESRLPSIGFDNFGPSYKITEYLLDLGHRHIAVLYSHFARNDRIAARYDGILRCLADHGVALLPALSVGVGYTIAEGRLGLQRLLETGERFTAVVTTGDVPAVGAVIEARRRGLKVPRDLSITGFHDHDIAAQLDPPLSTVHAPVREMCIAAADYLLAAIEGETPECPPLLPTSLVLRESAGPPPRRMRKPT